MQVSTPTIDLLVRGGTVIDGLGAEPQRADVAVSGGRIVAVGDLPEDMAAATVVDATGLTVTPGFIDVHTHTDALAFLPGHDEIHTASVRQGVTSEVCGNCGFSPFPADPAAGLDRDPYLSALGGGVARPFASLADFRAALDEADLPVHRAPLVGHATLRAAVMGYDDRPPTSEELREMTRQLDRAFDEGAIGLSTGLVYPPGQFADTDELSALASVAARHGRLYTSHTRNEMEYVTEAIGEALAVGRASGAAVQISHHKVAGKPNHGRVGRTLVQIEAARAEGVDVAVDLYPYTAASTMLAALLPPWVNGRSPDERRRLLGDGQARRRMAKDHHDGLRGWQDFAKAAGWDGVVLADHPEFSGRTIADVDPGRDPWDVLCDLLLEDLRLTCVLHMMDAGDVAEIDAQPYTLIGSDGLPVPGRQHPRVAGTFAAALSSRPDGMDLVERVRRMTSVPARRFGLVGRGELRDGAHADLVLLDPAGLASRATYDDPWARPVGIRTVVVGGQVVIDGGVDTGARPGRVLGADEY